MTLPKVGDVLWHVRLGVVNARTPIDPPEVERATVTRVTSQKVWVRFDSGPYSAEEVGIARAAWPDDALSASRGEAVDRALARRRHHVERTRERAARMEADLPRIEALR